MACIGGARCHASIGTGGAWPKLRPSIGTSMRPARRLFGGFMTSTSQWDCRRGFMTAGAAMRAGPGRSAVPLLPSPPPPPLLGCRRPPASDARSVGSSGSGSSAQSYYYHTQRRAASCVVRAKRVTTEELREKRDTNPYIRALNEAHGADGFVEFYLAEGGLPACYLTHPRGHTLEVYLQGATATRWLDAAGRNLLALRPDAEFAPNSTILGSGVSIAFPQWRDGVLPTDGFAGALPWEVVDAGLGFDFQNLIGGLAPKGDEDSEFVPLVTDGGESLVGGPFTDEDPNPFAGLEAAAEAAAAAAAAAGDAAGGRAPRRGRKAAATAAAAEGEGEGGEGAADAAPKKRRGRPRKTDAGTAAGSGADSASGSDADDGGGDADAAAGGRVVAAAAVEDEEGVWGSGDGGDGDDGGNDGDGELPEWLEELTEDGIDFGLIGDVAPYVTLRLVDNEATRALWPHAFELTVKISLTETDDFPDPLEGLPKGLVPWDLARNAPRAPAAPDAPDPLEPVELARNDLADLDEADAPPMQVKYEFSLRNTASPGDATTGDASDAAGGAFDFQLAATPYFATRDQTSASFGPFVRALGLGAQTTVDYGYDPRFPVLSHVDDDYVNYGQRRIDFAAAGASKSQVLFCPGDRTHFELLPRKGMPDIVAYHPGPGARAQGAFWRFYAALGAGRVVLPKTLKPGEEYEAELVVRRHERYWTPPMWARAAPQPMPQWLPPGAGGEGGEDDYIADDGVGGGGGGGGEGGLDGASDDAAWQASS